MTIKNQKFKKKKHLRNNEYYNLQNEFDKLILHLTKKEV